MQLYSYKQGCLLYCTVHIVILTNMTATWNPLIWLIWLTTAIKFFFVLYISQLYIHIPLWNHSNNKTSLSLRKCCLYFSSFWWLLFGLFETFFLPEICDAHILLSPFSPDFVCDYTVGTCGLLWSCTSNKKRHPRGSSGFHL